MVGDHPAGRRRPVGHQVNHGGRHSFGRGDHGQLVILHHIVGAVSDSRGAADIGMDYRHQLADVAHIRAAGAMFNLAHILGADQRFGIGAENRGHLIVLRHRQIARNGLNVDCRSHGHSAGAQGPVNLAVGVLDCLQRPPAHESFHPHIRRHCGHGLAAFGDNRMHADGVAVLESFPVEVDGRHRQGGGVQRVDAQMGGAAGVGAFADKPDFLGQGAVVGAADGQLPLAGRAGGVQHHRQMHVIEFSEPDEFRLAAEELNLAVAPQPVPVLNLDVFLGRRCHCYDAPAQMRQHVIPHQGHGCAQHQGNLAVMPAGVGRAGCRVGVGMFVDNQAVQLPDDGHCRALAAAQDFPPHSGHCQPGTERHAHCGELFPYQSGSFEFAKPGLRVGQNLLRNADQLVGPPVNFGKRPVLQISGRRH